MALNSSRFAFAFNLRGLTRVALPVLVIVVALSWAVVSIGNSLNGWWATSKVSTTDTVGHNMGPTSDRTCFLSGVGGDLNKGAQPGFGCGSQGLQSIAEVGGKPSDPDYWLMAHGGACSNQVNQLVWNNNEIKAQATCVFYTANVASGQWEHGNAVRITGPHASNNKVRQCFLTGLYGVAGAWNSSGNFARVHKVTASETDTEHPTTGWYIDANLPMPADGSHPRVLASCVDFPQGSVVTTGSESVSTVTKTHTLTSGTAVKACALTKVKGAFNVNNSLNGVLMKFPSSATGTWKLTISAGKEANWACVK